VPASLRRCTRPCSEPSTADVRPPTCVHAASDAVRRGVCAAGQLRQRTHGGQTEGKLGSPPATNDGKQRAATKRRSRDGRETILWRILLPLHSYEQQQQGQIGSIALPLSLRATAYTCAYTRQQQLHVAIQ
jgi:hypothetical protein